MIVMNTYTENIRNYNKNVFHIRLIFPPKKRVDETFLLVMSNNENKWSFPLHPKENTQMDLIAQGGGA